MGYRCSRLSPFDFPGALPAGSAPVSDSPLALVPAEWLPARCFYISGSLLVSRVASLARHHPGSFFLLTSGILLVLGQPAILAISLVVIGGYLFLRNRFLSLGSLLFMLSLAVKPQIGGLIVLYLLVQKIHWRYAALAMVGALALLLSAGLILKLHPRSADWISTLRANLTATLNTGGSADPRPANPQAIGDTNLQTLSSIFFADAARFNAAAYIAFLLLLAAWVITVLRKHASPELHVVALGSLSILSLTPVYHRFYDTRLTSPKHSGGVDRFPKAPVFGSCDCHSHCSLHHFRPVPGTDIPFATREMARYAVQEQIPLHPAAATAESGTADPLRPLPIRPALYSLYRPPGDRVRSRLSSGSNGPSDAMSKVSPSDEQSASTIISALPAIEAQQGISFYWQLLIFGVSLFAIFTRLPGAWLHPQFFAEDGWVWYEQAYNLGWLQSLGNAQAGYMQTFPRLVAGLALLFPMQWAPLIMNLAGAVVQALPATALLSRRCAPWGPLRVRMWMAGLYIAIPDAPEIHVVLTNAMWHLALLQALLAFSLPPLSSARPRIRRRSVCYRRHHRSVLHSAVACGRRLLVDAAPALDPGRLGFNVVGRHDPGADNSAHRQKTWSASRGHASSPLAYHCRSTFIDSMVGSGGPYLPIPLLVVGAIGGLAILFWGWRSASLELRLYCLFAVMALVASLRDPLLLPGSTPRWGGTRQSYWNSLLVLSLADVSLVSSVVRIKRTRHSGAACWAGCSASNYHWDGSEMDLSALA